MKKFYEQVILCNFYFITNMLLFPVQPAQEIVLLFCFCRLSKYISLIQHDMFACQMSWSY